MALTGLMVSLLIGWLLVRFEGLHAHFSHDHTASGPQKFHSRPTPRIGGVPIGGGFAAAVAVGVAGGALELSLAVAFGIAVLPAFLSGLVEDLTKKIGPDIRLWASFLSALIAIHYFDVVVDRSGIPPVDALLAWYPLALVFTVVGIGGVAHAVNIIDGYNGLAAMVTMMMLAALGLVAGFVGDLPLAALCVALAASTLGFFRWNFPWGRIFAGDGGAYLWGVSIAIISVLLIKRNPTVSPWFPLAVAIYPVFETLFSVYRRKLKHSAAAGLPDAKHLHQLVYRRLLFRGAEYRVNCPDLKTLRNASASPFLWLLASSSIVPAVLFWNQGPALAGIAGVFCLLYVWHYRAIATLTTPRWLRRLAASISRTALTAMQRRHAKRRPEPSDQPARDAT